MKVFLFILLIGLLSCEDSKDCTTEPPVFMFEIIDKSSGENLFTNGTFKSDEIIVTDTKTNTKVPFRFISENDINLLTFNGIGWEKETLNYIIKIQEKAVFEIYVDADRKSSDGCTFTVINEFAIKNSDYELLKEKGIYIIKVTKQ